MRLDREPVLWRLDDGLGGDGDEALGDGGLGIRGDGSLGEALGGGSLGDERLGGGDRLRELHVDTLAPSRAARSVPP